MSEFMGSYVRMPSPTLISIPDTFPYLFTGVQVLGRGDAFIRGVIRQLDERRVPHTFVARYHAGKWSAYSLDCGVVSQCLSRTDTWRMFSLCYDGSVHIATPEEKFTEMIDDSDFGPSPLRWMFEISQIGTSIFASGMARMVYKRLGPRRWKSINPSALNDSQNGLERGFRSISGWNESRLVAVGLFGEVWMRDEDLWRQMDSPTNVTLHCVRCLSDGRAYASGARGVILTFQNDEWRIVPHSIETGDLWSLQEFMGHVYFADRKAVYRLENEMLLIVECAELADATCGYLHSSGDAMWSVGSSDLFQFDGEKWERILPPTLGHNGGT